MKLLLAIEAALTSENTPSVSQAITCKLPKDLASLECKGLWKENVNVTPELAQVALVILMQKMPKNLSERPTCWLCWIQVMPEFFSFYLSYMKDSLQIIWQMCTVNFKIKNILFGSKRTPIL